MADALDDIELEKQNKINNLNNQKSKYTDVKTLISPITTDLDNVKIKFKDTKYLDGIEDITDIINNIDIIKTSVEDINSIINDAISKIDADISTIKNQ